MTPKEVLEGLRTEPKRATDQGWRYLGNVRIPVTGVTGQAYTHADGISVLSAVEIAEQNPPGSGIVVPHYHVSATHRAGKPRACTDQEMELVRAAFDLGGAEEDNHGPGIARHLWIAVGRDREPTCPCKQDEERTVDGPRVRFDEQPNSEGSR